MISPFAPGLGRCARHVCVLAAVLAGALALPGVARAGGFSDEFSSPVLDPGWTVVNEMGFNNRYSLTDNPGHLRYSLDAMTHDDGYLNGYQPTTGYHSCCTHVAGMELQRSFTGGDWTFDTKVDYFMPFANGRRLGPRIYFGGGGPGTFYVVFERGRDVHPFNGLVIRLVEKFGPTLNDQTTLEQHVVDLGGFGPPESTHYFRLERAGGVLTAKFSDDGVTWTTAWSRDLGSQLDGLDQRVVIAGLSWFVPAGSYADYDYVRVDPVRFPQHFLRYQLDQPEASGETLTLRDQFGELRVRLEEAEWLLTPADKRRAGREPEPMQRPDEHLVCYGLPYIPTADRTVVVRNQFTESTLRVGRPLTLCSPASKSFVIDPGPPPDDLDHYLCYDVRGETPRVTSETLGVGDQFGSRSVRIDRTRELCNPVEKQRDGRPPEPIKRPEEHVVCYRITTQAPVFTARSGVRTMDQFGEQTLAVAALERLCVPSTKDEGGGGA
jgi:hypothetical protein